MTSRYEGATFSAPEARCRRFTAQVLAHASASRPARVLEIGCGTGMQLCQLAAALPAATLVGVDISAPNVEAARRRAAELGLSSRVSFAASDYLAFTRRPHDLIVSYSTLQLIPGDSGTLFRKISDDLVAGALFINVMPFECAYNSALMAVRRVFAACRSRFTDALVFRAAKLVHGGEFEEQLLRERVDSMYIILERFDGPELRRLMREECALDLVAEAPEPHASPAQTKHRLSVFRKRPAA